MPPGDPSTDPTGGAPSADPSQDPSQQPPGAASPAGAAGAVDNSVPQQGMEAMGREVGRKVIMLLHQMQIAFSPFSDEAKATSGALKILMKCFKPEDQNMVQGPGLSGGGQAGPGGAPQLAGQGGPGPMPDPPQGPIPSLSGQQ